MNWFRRFLNPKQSRKESLISVLLSIGWYVLFINICILSMTIALFFKKFNKIFPKIQFLLKRFIGLSFYFTFSSLHIKRFELPSSPCIYVQNHVSLIDFLVSFLVIDRPFCLHFNHWASKIPIIGHLAKLFNPILQSPDLKYEDLLIQVEDRIKKGYSVLFLSNLLL